MEASFIVQSNHGIMAEQDEDLGSSSLDEETEESSNSISSSSSDFLEDATSSLSNGSQEEEEGPLFEMSDLFSQLPFKRGLSKHFQGKSQSFSSLTNVRRLEDLAKPERAYKKKLISSKSYGGGLDCNKALSCAKAITKKSSKVSFSSLGPRRKGFFGSSRASFVSLRSSGDLSGQALLFA